LGKLEETALVEEVRIPKYHDDLVLTTISLLIHGADRDGAPASVTSPS